MGSLSVSHNASPPVDSCSFASPEYQYHYPFGTPLEIDYGNSVMPRQDPPLSSFYTSPHFVDHPPQMVGNGFTPLPSPEHSLPGYEQTQDPRSGHFFGTGPSYALYQEPATLATGNEPCQDPTMMWNALVHDVSLSQPIEQPSFFGDAMIMTPASVSLSTSKPRNSSHHRLSASNKGILSFFFYYSSDHLLRPVLIGYTQHRLAFKLEQQ